MSVSMHSNAPPVTGRVDFGWIGQAWALFSAQAGVWIGAVMLYFLLDTAVWLLLAIPTGQLASLQRTYTVLLTTHAFPPAGVTSYREFVQDKITSILGAGLGVIFNGGFYRIALRQKRGELVSAADLFSAFPQALPLSIVGIALPTGLAILEGIGLWLMHFSMTPTSAVMAVGQIDTFPALLLPGLFMFAPLLVLDTDATAAKALLGSVRLLKGQLWRGAWFYVVSSFVSGIGFLLCGVGLLATYPISFIGIAIGYLVLTQPATDRMPPFDPAPVGVWPPPPRVR